ncbi:ferredoxin-type protein NapG [Ignatzschineria sp. LJL83]
MKKNRRKFLADIVKVGGAACLAGTPLAMLATQSQAANKNILRPPGAIDEADFLSACTRCGLCVRACPYDTLKLSELSQPSFGTPFFTPREIPCEMCEDLPCINACPTGALDQSITEAEDIRMGTAVLIDEENCLAFLGLRCEVCYRVCPVIDKAITLERQENQRTGVHAEFIPVVHAEYCTGCGICEEKCVLEHDSAIKVIPTNIARSKLPDHYRVSWEEETAESLSIENIPLKRFVP